MIKYSDNTGTVLIEIFGYRGVSSEESAGYFIWLL